MGGVNPPPEGRREGGKEHSTILNHPATGAGGIIPIHRFEPFFMDCFSQFDFTWDFIIIFVFLDFSMFFEVFGGFRPRNRA